MRRWGIDGSDINGYESWRDRGQWYERVMRIDMGVENVKIGFHRVLYWTYNLRKLGCKGKTGTQL